MKFINIRPVYIKGGQNYGAQGWVVAKVKTKKEDDTKVEFRVALISTYTHKVANIPLQGLDRYVVTMGGPYY